MPRAEKPKWLLVISPATLSGGPVDILVNNAGVLNFSSWTDVTITDWVEKYNINVIAGVRMIQRLVPPMRERRWGRVIQIGGGLALQPLAGQPGYSMTLAARHNLAVSLARELKDSGVTSNIVAPGAVLTEEARPTLAGMAASRGWGRPGKKSNTTVRRPSLQMMWAGLPGQRRSRRQSLSWPTLWPIM